MGSRALEIDWLPSTRIAELRAFLEVEWRTGHVLARDEKLLRWQHPRNSGELSFVAATEGGALLGVLGVIPVGIAVHGTRVPGAWLTTWAVTPAARPRRIGLELLDFALAGHDFAGTIGGNATTMTILRALRFETLPAVPRWIRPLDSAALQRLVGGLPETVRPSAPDGRGFSIHDWTPADSAPWDRYWESTLASALVGTWRDARYLGWRYLSHPRFDYRVRIAIAKTGEPAGILVHRLERASGADAIVLRIVEALGEEGAVAALAKDLVESGCEVGAAFADFYCTGGRFARPLEAAGFVLESELAVDFPSRFQPLEPGSRPLTAALRLTSGDPGLLAGPNVYFTRSDCDQDRPS